MNKTTEVKIFGQTFEISSPRLSERELRSLAQFVDERMKETFTATNLSSALKVAVLTALNLAEEIRSIKEVSSLEPSLDWSQTVVDISKKLDLISDSLEEFIHEQ